MHQHLSASLPSSGESLGGRDVFFCCFFFNALRLIYFNYIECSKLDFVHPILPIIFFPLSPVDVGDTCIFSRFLKL